MPSFPTFREVQTARLHAAFIRADAVEDDAERTKLEKDALTRTVSAFIDEYVFTGQHYWKKEDCNVLINFYGPTPAGQPRLIGGNVAVDHGRSGWDQKHIAITLHEGNLSEEDHNVWEMDFNNIVNCLIGVVAIVRSSRMGRQGSYENAKDMEFDDGTGCTPGHTQFYGVF